MKGKEYISIAEFAKILGISRIAVYNRIKKGRIKAIRIGRSYAIPRRYLDEIIGNRLGEKEKKLIDEAVEKTFREYGEVIRRLGRE